MFTIKEHVTKFRASFFMPTGGTCFGIQFSLVAVSVVSDRHKGSSSHLIQLFATGVHVISLA